jgi:hypothetical protein
MGKQKIHGNNNQQAGNDIINNFGDDNFDPNNPNIIDCPSCWKQTSKFANECQRCGYAVLEHLKREIIRKEIIPLKKRLKVALLCTVISMFMAYYFSMPVLVMCVVVPFLIYINSLEHKIKRMSRIN